VGFFSPTARHLKAEGPYIQIILSILSKKKIKIESIPYLNWHRLTKKEKKAVAKKVLDEVVVNYDFKQKDNDL